MSRRLVLGKEWTLGDRIGGGGFGQVFAASAAGEQPAVAKLVPKDPGAERELLFVDLAGIRNVVPVIDSGETDDSWVLVMPRADKSLRDHIREDGKPFNAAGSLAILADLAVALVDLSGKGIVHRDVKPENILLLAGKWCLADFGISRYAEATTAPDTRKHALSPIYAAPERWRVQRATSAADIYSLGVVAYELVAGVTPFHGPKAEDLREQHLHARADSIANVVSALDGLIAECLYKAPEARPTPANVVSRIEYLREKSSGVGLAKLREAHREEVARKSELGRIESERQSEADRRTALVADAKIGLKHIAKTLQDAVMLAAPSVSRTAGRGEGWKLRLDQCTLEFSPTEVVSTNPWGFPSRGPIKLDVVACATIGVRIPEGHSVYEGRSHSLWYCDARQSGQYYWYETRSGQVETFIELSPRNIASMWRIKPS